MCVCVCALVCVLIKINLDDGYTFDGWNRTFVINFTFIREGWFILYYVRLVVRFMLEVPLCILESCIHESSIVWLACIDILTS